MVPTGWAERGDGPERHIGFQTVDGICQKPQRLATVGAEHAEVRGGLAHRHPAEAEDEIHGIAAVD